MTRRLSPRTAFLSLTLAGLCAAAPAAKAQAPDAAALQGWAEDPPVLSALVAFAQTESDLRASVVRYVEDKAAIGRRYPVLYSSARAARLRAFHEGWRARLIEVDFNSLNQEGRIDYILLRNRIDYDLAMLDLAEQRAKEIAPLVPFADSIRRLEETRLDRRRADPRESASLLNDLVRQVEALTAALVQEAARRNGLVVRRGITPAIALRAAEHVEHLRETLKNWNTFYDGYDPEFSWWVRKPYAALDAAFSAYAAAIKAHMVGIKEGKTPPIVGDPVLAEGLQADLAVEMIPYTPKELIAIGEKEFAWIETEMKKVARDMGFGDDWQAALEHVKNLAPPPGEIPWTLYDIADYSETFIENLDVINMPPLAREVWRFAMQTPERQLYNPFFSGGEVTRLSYPTDGMEHDQKMMSMRGNTPHFNFPTVQHELVPGHHLQSFMNRRFNSHRAALNWTPFWTEGWALYWELILWDRGFARNDPDKIGMLFWRMHRAARIIFSLNYQLGNWSPEQCVNFLVERVGHERANAEAEVRRTARDAPLYQIAYMTGALQIRALRRELVESGLMSEEEFHNAILIGGPMPIELVRARLTGKKLTRDYQSQWRFYNEAGR
ncbi:DUF885 family protein [Amphiplicatus metriothermophilus]|uniref:DUF885 domain-containing protein n=1 Tax=Amphiplicatus metriothermophilus TaxID=1519374 RepID=A0A239PQX2_9PROT|nr:DUF885 family protein [Amphiplicatus metriothermophilus]MBB5518392.1 uncharacterized protein (DUF885 family) [Amphiplicatus metriothermophilus]SNT72443.1 protein of unknown function [Amphiplicatus metriothermophilus]